MLFVDIVYRLSASAFKWDYVCMVKLKFQIKLTQLAVEASRRLMHSWTIQLCTEHGGGRIESRRCIFKYLQAVVSVVERFYVEVASGMGRKFIESTWLNEWWENAESLIQLRKRWDYFNQASIWKPNPHEHGDEFQTTESFLWPQISKWLQKLKITFIWL